MVTDLNETANENVDVDNFDENKLSIINRWDELDIDPCIFEGYF